MAEFGQNSVRFGHILSLNMYAVSKVNNFFLIHHIIIFSAGALKRILIIVDHIKTNTEDCIQLLVKYYSGVLVDGVDTQAILASYAKVSIGF